MHSESLNEIAAALVKARANMHHPAYNAEGQARGGRYPYANLAAVIDSTLATMAEAGIAITQTPEILDDGRMVLRTLMLHTSGQWIDSTMPLPADAKSQDLGSALTYARRYALSAIAGVASEHDDDGDAAQNPTVVVTSQQKASMNPLAVAQMEGGPLYANREELTGWVVKGTMAKYRPLVAEWLGDANPKYSDLESSVSALVRSVLLESYPGAGDVPSDSVGEIGREVVARIRLRVAEVAESRKR